MRAFTQIGNLDEEEEVASDTDHHRDELPPQAPVPEGYEAVPLIDAINGPTTTSDLASIPLVSGEWF